MNAKKIISRIHTLFLINYYLLEGTNLKKNQLRHYYIERKVQHIEDTTLLSDLAETLETIASESVLKKIVKTVFGSRQFALVSKRKTELE